MTRSFSIDYPKNSTFTDKIQVALAKCLFADNKGNVVNIHQVKDLSLIDEIMKILVDGENVSNQNVSTKLKSLVEGNDPSDPKIKSLLDELELLLKLEEAQDISPRFNQNPNPNPLRQKIKHQAGSDEVQTDDHFIKISEKHQGRGSHGFIAVKRINRPADILTGNIGEKYRGKYLTPWMVKSVDQHRVAGEDFVSQAANYYDLEPKFRKTDLREKGGLRFSASKYVPDLPTLESHNKTKVKEKLSLKEQLSLFKRSSKIANFSSYKKSVSQQISTKNVEAVQQLLFAMLAGQSDLNSGNILLKKDSEENVKLVIIDRDVSSHDMLLFHSYFRTLSDAVSDGDFQEAREILSFKRMSDVYQLLYTYHNCNDAGKQKLLKGFLENKRFNFIQLKKDGSFEDNNQIIQEKFQSFCKLAVCLNPEIPNELYNLVLKTSDEEILLAFKNITDRSVKGLSAQREEYEELGEIGVTPSGTIEEPKGIEKFGEYIDPIINLLKEAKPKIDRRYDEMVKKKKLKPSSKSKLSEPTKQEICCLNYKGKSYDLAPENMIKYLAGHYAFVEAVKDGMQYKGIIPKELTPFASDDIYKDSIKKIIANIDVDQGLTESNFKALLMAFPDASLTSAVKAEGNFNLEIKNRINFKEVFKACSENLKTLVANNFIEAVDVLEKLIKNNKNLNKDTKDRFLTLLDSANKNINILVYDSSKKEELKSKIEGLRSSITHPQHKFSPEPLAPSSLSKMTCDVIDLQSKNKPSSTKVDKLWHQKCIAAGRFLYSFKFDNSADNFSFIDNEARTQEDAYRRAKVAINNSIHELFTREPNVFTRVIESLSQIKDEGCDEKVKELKDAISSEPGNNINNKKLILSFIVESARDNGSFKDSDVVNNLPDDLRIGFKHISAKMQKHNEENGIMTTFSQGKKPVGMRSKRMMLESVEEYRPQTENLGRPKVEVRGRSAST